MKIVGIDYSMSSPGVVTYTGELKDFSFDKCKASYLTSVKKYQLQYNNITGDKLHEWESQEQRYNLIADWTMDLVEGADYVAIEGYSMQSSGRVFNIAENCGLLKHKLWQNGYNTSIYSPSEIKKFATGKGNANKDGMYTAFVGEGNPDIAKTITPDKKGIQSPVADIVDAFYICKLLADKLMNGSIG